MTDLTSTLASLQRLAEEVTRLGEKATPGAWDVAWGMWGEFCYIARNDTGKKLATVYGTDKQKKVDGEFIAHARTAAPLLASAVLALVEVARDVRAIASIRTHSREDASDMLDFCERTAARALSRLSALSPKEGE